MKRKTNPQSQGANGQPDSKKRALSSEEAAARFRDGLFEPSVQENYTKEYADSAPYKHGVIHPLIEPSLLRSVRDEIQAQVDFTEKETDIYKIFQSGDLANLDGLDDTSLSRLPSLLKLRDAMYSARFREYLSSVTNSGKLSGKKTDMAINIYNEGCHLLCHDDVIGSRRLSYILYLTDPDTPWQAEWGGALRLFPTSTKKDANGEDVKVPSPDYSLSIPPAFNQLSFFTVQPGESFHDVEEVYHPKEGDDKSKKRVRMAISGWFHIPQKGEDGYEEGLEEKLAERSSLAQLQGRGDIYDLPQPQPTICHEDAEQKVEGKGKGKMEEVPSGTEFNEADLNFLVQYIAPSYLTPDIAEEMSETFGNESSLNLERFLSEKFAARVQEYIAEQERTELPKSSDEIKAQTGWTVARPPHKQRYMFQQYPTTAQDQKTPIQELLNGLFPSPAFRKWLALVTGAERITSYDYLARRFRRGQDYTLASGYDGEEPRLEFTLCLTPTPGWEKEGDEDEDEMDEAEDGKGESAAAKKPKKETKEASSATHEEPAVGGYEIYMAGDDEDEGDAAIYRSAAAEEDDGILFSTAAGWNRLSIVLRDSGTLKFVKYVSAAAQGDRWDLTGDVGVDFGEDEDEDDEEDAEVEEEDDEEDE
ncbi:putative component of NuA3 histone acetyltransferase complex [Aspergillus steynii IBT 23096]|uniref:uS12 prolyl 3,4-dihydroxylase n=1 Tax=Aspergillus steynii IBT 23096 TaxID=1392250 RepID=A0A2I2GDM2_9EURO|nr:putative component of NuA3 histone acetyltransferase complex [Aspergillus steynii IBT 23096]PLB50973.1 putative component of NuA3 histone acetyltransferase complex [Aspergillus steynii IBT 23096]